jgi:hypothetical protein
MYESKAFPTREMLGLNPNRLGLKLTDAEIIAHPEFAVRLDLITEQMRANGCYFGVETLAFGDFLCALNITKQLSEDILARLRGVKFPFSWKGEMVFVITIFIIRDLIPHFSPSQLTNFSWLHSERMRAVN